MGFKLGISLGGNSLVSWFFENRVLRKIFDSKRDEVTRGWRQLHNEEPRSLYPSPSIVQMIGSMIMRLGEE
jgi:hypothetical protein